MIKSSFLTFSKRIFSSIIENEEVYSTKKEKWCMMRKKWMISFLLVLLALTACGGPKAGELIPLKNRAAYDKALKEEVSFIYFAKEDCSYCDKFKPVLDEQMKTAQVYVYYYDLQAHESDQDYQEIRDASEVFSIPRLVGYKQGLPFGFVDHLSTPDDVLTLLQSK